MLLETRAPAESVGNRGTGKSAGQSRELNAFYSGYGPFNRAAEPLRNVRVTGCWDQEPPETAASSTVPFGLVETLVDMNDAPCRAARNAIAARLRQRTEAADQRGRLNGHPRRLQTELGVPATGSTDDGGRAGRSKRGSSCRNNEAKRAGRSAAKPRHSRGHCAALVKA